MQKDEKARLPFRRFIPFGNEIIPCSLIGFVFRTMSAARLMLLQRSNPRLLA